MLMIYYESCLLTLYYISILQSAHAIQPRNTCGQRVIPMINDKLKMALTSKRSPNNNF